ncbi:MAG TPA: alanine racemase [Stellaceae bacterium]|jgi:alanine racemase|nr:alanine racemase [Stellaceae bacterium]
MTGNPADRAGAILEVDLAGIAANWRHLARRTEPAGCAAVVKADAYGLGASLVGPALAAAGCRQFFVATIDEGIALRRVLPQSAEIAVFNGLLPGCADDFFEFRLIPVLNDPGQIADWRSAASRHGERPAILHIDTGMGRLGLTVREFDRLAEDLRHSDPIQWHALISHLACSDEPRHPLNGIQLERFAAARQRLAHLPASLVASSGIFLGPEFHFDFARPGAALYGVNPQPGCPNPMRQIVRLKGRILQIREVDRDQTVGYGASHVMAAPGRLATVAVGYADGWLRSVSQRGSGRVGGKRVRLLGRVSMDLIVFDVSGVDPVFVQPGRFIELLHEDYGVDAAAADAGTIGYEILTALGRRYHRVYRGAPRQC